jgi:hypothetical protein
MSVIMEVPTKEIPENKAEENCTIQLQQKTAEVCIEE